MENIDCEFKKNPPKKGPTMGNIVRMFNSHLGNTRTVFEENVGRYGGVIRIRGPRAVLINNGTIFR